MRNKSTLKVIYLSQHLWNPCITLYPVKQSDEASNTTSPNASKAFLLCQQPHQAAMIRCAHQRHIHPQKFIFQDCTPGPKSLWSLNSPVRLNLSYSKRTMSLRQEVAAALTRTHPCWGQLGTKTGYWGWKQSLKYKMQNYQTQLGRLGHPDIRLSSLKHK